jgi:hypothetical protein
VHAGDFTIINFAEFGSGEANAATAKLRGYINQTDTRQHARNALRTNIAARRHNLVASLGKPIVIKLPLLRHNKLRAKGIAYRCQFQFPPQFVESFLRPCPSCMNRCSVIRKSPKDRKVKFNFWGRFCDPIPWFSQGLIWF